MRSADEWIPNATNTIQFVLTDQNGLEVTGEGSGFTLNLRKAGGSFAVSAGSKSEIGLGWYEYITTAAEADTYGPVAISITSPGSIQQNLEYVVGTRVAGAKPFTYTALDSITSLPVAYANVWATTDNSGTRIVWTGKTDGIGVARDIYGNLPLLKVGTYYFWLQKDAYIPATNPDQESVI